MSYLFLGRLLPSKEGGGFGLIRVNTITMLISHREYTRRYRPIISCVQLFSTHISISSYTIRTPTAWLAFLKTAQVTDSSDQLLYKAYPQFTRLYGNAKFKRLLNLLRNSDIKRGTVDSAPYLRGYTHKIFIWLQYFYLFLRI